LVATSDQKELVKLLQDVPLFASMNDRHLRRLAKEGKPLSFSSGEMIIKKGAAGIGFYLVLKGRVQVKKGDRVLTELGRGQFFGEMALLDNGPRSVDVVASEPTKCFCLTFWDLHGIRHKDPKITEAILKELARRLRQTDEML
jgi:CRP-like cAMP-binding protein